jgi:hypothetical protein
MEWIKKFLRLAPAKLSSAQQSALQFSRCALWEITSFSRLDDGSLELDLQSASIGYHDRCSIHVSLFHPSLHWIKTLSKGHFVKLNYHRRSHPAVRDAIAAHLTVH